MSNVSLFESSHSDLKVTNEEFCYSGKAIKISDVSEATGTLVKPNYSPVLALGLIGIVLSVLGKLRVGLIPPELFHPNSFGNLNNAWDITGLLVILVGMLIFILLKDKYLVHIQMKDGGDIQFLLKEKGDQFAIDEVDQALRQAVRYNQFLSDSENKEDENKVQ